MNKAVEKAFTGHSEPVDLCHSEGVERPKNLAQGKLREKSLKLTEMVTENILPK